MKFKVRKTGCSIYTITGSGFVFTLPLCSGYLKEIIGCNPMAFDLTIKQVSKKVAESYEYYLKTDRLDGVEIWTEKGYFCMFYLAIDDAFKKVCGDDCFNRVKYFTFEVEYD